MKRLILIALFCLAGLGLLLAFTAQPAPAADEAAAPPEWQVVRAYFTDRQMVYDLAEWREPWEVHYDKAYVVLEATPAEMDRLIAAGFRLEVDETLTELYFGERPFFPEQTEGIPGYACYRTVEETFTTAQTIVAEHPTLASWIDIGDSWEKTAGIGGYDLMVLKLTNAEVAVEKPKLFIMSAVHAREYTTAELVTRYAEYLVDNYGIDADATWLLDEHEIHLLLQANPDGRKKAEAGASWRKNTNQNYCGATSNNRGADLNRNFSFLWGGAGASANPCDITYRGPFAASEPETQAIQNYVRAEFPDQRDDPINSPAPADAMGVFLDIHSYSRLVLWPWGHVNTPAPNGTALQTLGRKFAYFNGYEPDQSIGLYPTTGTTDDFAYGELGLAGFTFELGTAFFQDCASFESTIYPDNLQALIYAAKVARTPYLTPAGPDALNLMLSDFAPTPGQTITLTAVLDDTRFNNQNGTEPVQTIQAAEAYLNTPPWADGAIPLPLAAADGSFNQPIETVYGAIETTGLANGRHTLFVRGQDAAGNWGPVSATFLYVLDPATAPQISGRVRAADSGLPLAATISTNAVFQTTAGADGFYAMQVISGTYTVTATPLDPNYAPATAVVSVADSQAVLQNFVLYPFTTLFFDDVESGNVGWTADPPWTIVTEAAYSPTHSWTESPGGNYTHNRNVSLTSPVFDLSDYQGIRLNYWQICDTEATYDFCRVEVSTNGGASWQEVTRFDGRSSVWREIDLPLPMLDGQPNARFRFRFTSDVSVAYNGWNVDDINLIGVSTDVGPLYGVALSPDMTHGAVPGEVVSYPVQISNMGNVSDTFSLSLSDHTWATSLSVSSISLEPAETATLTVTVTVPTDALNEESDMASLTAVSLADPDQTATTSLTTSVEILYGVALEADSTAQSGNPGDTITYTLQISNTGNFTDMFSLSLEGSDWDATLSSNSLTLAADETAVFTFTVTIPLTATHLMTDTVTVTAVSLGDPEQVERVDVVTTAVRFTDFLYLPLINKP